jgi:hypothetical protein
MHLCHDHLVSKLKFTLTIDSTFSDTLNDHLKGIANLGDQHV